LHANAPSLFLLRQRDESPGIREIPTFDHPENVDTAASFSERTTLNDNRSNLMMIGV